MKATYLDGTIQHNRRKRVSRPVTEVLLLPQWGDPQHYNINSCNLYTECMVGEGGESILVPDRRASLDLK